MEEINDPSIELHPDIAHLSPEQIEEMRDDYQKGDLKVKEIMVKYGLEGFHPSIFYKRIPPRVDRSMACPVCNVYSIRLLQGRGMSYGEPFCPTCGQVLISRIDPEQRARELRILRKETRIYEYYGSVVEIPYLDVEITRETFNQLSFERKVFLSTIIASCVGEDLEMILGEDIEKRKICPTELLFDEMVTSLILSNVLPSNELWRTRIRVERELTEDLLSPQDRFGSDAGEQLDFWKKIAYHEVAEYYTKTMEGISLSTAIGQKGELNIKMLVDELSVSQIIFFIYTSSRDACEFIVKEKGSQPHAANIVLYNCLKKKDRYISNKWDIKKFIRPVNQCSQSEISSYFFDKILRIGDKGFSHRPNFDDINPIEVHMSKL